MEIPVVDFGNYVRFLYNELCKTSLLLEAMKDLSRRVWKLWEISVVEFGSYVRSLYKCLEAMEISVKVFGNYVRSL